MREGDTLAAGATGDDDNPLSDGAGGDSSIPPVRQSALFPIFRRGNDRLGGSLATASREQNVTNVSDVAEGGTGAARRASHPLAASAALASGGGIAATASSLLIAAGHWVMRASIDEGVGEMESSGDTTTPAWRLLAAATRPPLSTRAFGGGTAAAANSLSAVDARSETQTPTEDPGQVPLGTHPRMLPWRLRLAAMPLPWQVFCWPWLLVVEQVPRPTDWGWFHG